MIEELSFENFLSFRDKTTISFEATNDDMGESTHVVKKADGKRLLRFAMIYGANASGKTNVLSALSFLESFMFSIKDSPEKYTRVMPFMFNSRTPDIPTKFSLRFYVGDVRYWYELELSRKEVLLEKLSVYKSVQPTILFNRTLENGAAVIKHNPSIIKISTAAHNEILVKCLKNMSYFAARDQVNVAIPLIDDARDWLRNNLLEMVVPGVYLYDDAKEQINSDAEIKKHIIDFISRADFNISNIETKEIMRTLPEEFKGILADLSEENKKAMLTSVESAFIHKIKTQDNSFEYYPLSEHWQSQGTKRTIGLEALLYHANMHNAILPIDEFEASLHPQLMEYLLQTFFDTNSQSQLIVTTHYDPLLDTVNDLIRKDSVWFTEKKEDGSTELYSLVEFAGLKRLSSIQRSYRLGRFGAIPNIE